MDVTELHDEENLLLRQTLGMGCKQRSVKSLAQQMGTTQKAIQKKLVSIVEKLRHHDDSIQPRLWHNRRCEAVGNPCRVIRKL